MNRRVLQFDIRVHKDDYIQAFWTAELRNLFLLDPGVEWPLSVDTLIWPSVFVSKLSTIKPFATIEVDVDAQGSDYWLRLQEMRAHVEAHQSDPSRGVPIAIELCSEQPLDDDIVPYEEAGGIACGLWLNATVPAVVPEESELLGYDVADAGRISGLTNCGYTEQDQQTLRPAWGSRLNRFGLLQTLDDAIEYRHVSDTRVAEHAPFWIYALWRVPPA